jgi:trigger factor
MIAGENRSAEVTFPLGYHNKELANKTANFDIQVKAVEIGQVPALDEGFIRDFGVSEGTVDALRKAVRDIMERHIADYAWQFVKTQVLDVLDQRNSLDLPQGMVRQEIARLRSLLSVGQNSEQAIANAASRNVKLFLLIHYIIAQEGISVDAEQVNAYVHRLVEDYETPGEVEQAVLADKSQTDKIEATIKEDRVVEWVLGQVRINRQPTPFSSLVMPSQPLTIRSV